MVGRGGSIPHDFVRLKLWDWLPNGHAIAYSIDAKRRQHPDWFRDDEVFSTKPSEESGTRADVEALLKSRDSDPCTSLEQVKEMLQSIDSRLSLAWDERGSSSESTNNPVTKNDIESMESRLSNILDTTNIRLGTVWWFSLGTLVGVGLTFVL